MLYRPADNYTVTNTFATSQFGEVGLAFGTKPLIQPTEVAVPALPVPDAIKAVEADNLARRVVLDDGSSTNYTATSNSATVCGTRPLPCLINGHLTPPYVSNEAPVRVGAKVKFTGDVIVDFRFSLWRFQPTSPVIGPDNAGAPVTFENTRTPAPNDAALGEEDITVASFNVLNYFTTLGEGAAGCLAFTDRDGDGNNVRTGCEQRGAWDSDDLARQQTKIVNAINALDADVVGLMEIENSAALGEPTDEALATLVAALNADAGAGTWAYVPSSTELPSAGTDVITQRDHLQAGRRAARRRIAGARHRERPDRSVRQRPRADRPGVQAEERRWRQVPVRRQPLQVEERAAAGEVVPPGDLDLGDGQGAFNAIRSRQATALRDWIPTVLDETSTSR